MCACVRCLFSEKNRTVVRRKHKELLRSSINDFFVFLSFYPLIINIQIMFDSEKYLARRMRNFFLFWMYAFDDIFKWLQIYISELLIFLMLKVSHSVPFQL